jgi:hypothetical protein
MSYANDTIPFHSTGTDDFLTEWNEVQTRRRARFQNYILHQHIPRWIWCGAISNFRGIEFNDTLTIISTYNQQWELSYSEHWAGVDGMADKNGIHIKESIMKEDS